MASLQELLARLGLEKYAEALRKEDINDLATAKTLSRDDLLVAFSLFPLLDLH